jgi:hypothetical protein
MFLQERVVPKRMPAIGLCFGIRFQPGIAMAGAAQPDQLRPRHGLTASLGKNRLEVSRNFHKAAEYDLTPTALM